MDPVVTSSLIKIGGSLLGGLFGKKKKSDPRGNSRAAILGQAQGAREAAEQYGFNPLTLLENSSAVGGDYGGSAPLSSAALIANGLTDVVLEATGVNDAIEAEREKAELDRLRKENEILNAGGAGEVSSRTVRIINSGGIATPRPSRAAPISVDDDEAATLEAEARKRANMTGSPGRDVEIAPVNNTGGTMDITNDWTGTLTVPTLDGDEPLDLGQAIVAAPVVIPQVLWNWGKRGVQAVNDMDPAVPPTVKYPSLSTGFHQNKKDAEAIRKQRKIQ